MSVDNLDVIYIVMESVIGMFAVVGNALVIWAVKLNPALQKITFFYIISLALTDIATGILLLPLAVTVSLGVIIHSYCTCCLMLIFSHAFILSPLTIAVSRYRVAVMKKRFCVVLGLCWLVSILVGLVTTLGWNQHTGNWSYTKCRYLAVMRMDYVVYFGFFTWFLLPLLITCALYTEIIYIVGIKLRPSSASPPGGGTVCGKEYKMAKYLALILISFAVSWLHLDIPNCISYFCPSCTIPQPLTYLGILLSHANSAMSLGLRNTEPQRNTRFHSEDLHPAPEVGVGYF
ncbi:adenosine receptor A3-like [Grus japonensis]|uniref:Adenosine receptor A3 n=1 Tax=Grus japonensis TaxID=30415 RepID=A0ABC9XQK9_GRUJA